MPLVCVFGGLGSLEVAPSVVIDIHEAANHHWKELNVVGRDPVQLS